MKTWDETMAEPMTITITRKQMERLVAAMCKESESWPVGTIGKGHALDVLSALRKQVEDCFPGNDSWD